MDPTALTALFAFLPPPYPEYAADAVGVAGVLSLVASAVSAGVKPPSTASAKWRQTLYKVVTWPALNFGWARNAVLPGMHPEVQQAVKLATEVVSQMPELAVSPPAVVVTGASAPSVENKA